MNPETLNVYANNHFGPALSFVLVAALDLFVLGLVLFCVRELARARRAVRAAEGAFDPHAPLVDRTRFVAGTVAFARDEKLAVRVSIEQHGSEQSTRNGTSHQWREVSRHTVARPFYIVHSSGARVRVTAGDADLVLVDQLDKREWTERTRRVRRAELSEGERVVAEGLLQRGHDPEAVAGEGYRGAPVGWSLGPLAGKLHLSTEGLARRHALRARAFTKALIALPLLAACALAPTAGYQVRALMGQDTEATFIGRSFWTTRTNKGGIVEHFAVSYMFERDGETVQDRVEVDNSDYFALPDATRGVYSDGHRVWVRAVRSFPSMNSLGRGATVHGGWWALSAGMCLLLLGWVLQKHQYRRWYERPLNDSGSGALPPPTGERLAP